MSGRRAKAERRRCLERYRSSDTRAYWEQRREDEAARLRANLGELRRVLRRRIKTVFYHTLTFGCPLTWIYSLFLLLCSWLLGFRGHETTADQLGNLALLLLPVGHWFWIERERLAGEISAEQTRRL